MAYSFCSECDASIDIPTIKEVLTDIQKCQSCGNEVYIDPSAKEFVIDEFIKRIERIEKIINPLPTWL